jgi:hypothetical protein
MPSPTTSLATHRPDLETFFQFDLSMDEQGFVGQDVLPVFEAGKSGGVFGKIPLAQLLQDRETKRAPRSGYARGDWNFEPATFATVEHGAEEVVDDNAAAMYSDFFTAETVSAARAYATLLRNYERRVAQAVFNTTTWNGAALTTSVGAVWSNPATDILSHVEAAVGKVYDGSGLWPNALIVNRKVFRLLRLNNGIRDRIASSGAGDPTKAADITPTMLAQVFDLDRVIVAGATRNNAKEGAAAAPQQIWVDTMAMVAKVATSQDMAEPCIGRTIHWNEDGSSVGGTFEEYREEAVRGKVLRVRHQVQELILYPQAGHLMQAVTT